VQDYRKYYIYLAVVVEFIALLLQFYIAFSAKEAGIHTVFKLSTFFTINSNFLLLICYMMLLIGDAHFWKKTSTQTALLTYISFVCIVYHVMLQDTWNPQGLQFWVAELFHWVNPLIYLIFWLIFVDKEKLAYKQIASWLIFPTIYFIWVLLIGAYGLGYPYPFLNVEKFGLFSVIMNGFVLLFVLTSIAALLILIGKNLPLQNVRKTDPAQNNSY
jgi:hypothetical protein